MKSEAICPIFGHYVRASCPTILSHSKHTHTDCHSFCVNFTFEIVFNEKNPFRGFRTHQSNYSLRINPAKPMIVRMQCTHALATHRIESSFSERIRTTHGDFSFSKISCCSFWELHSRLLQRIRYPHYLWSGSSSDSITQQKVKNTNQTGIENRLSWSYLDFRWSLGSRFVFFSLFSSLLVGSSTFVAESLTHRNRCDWAESKVRKRSVYVQ